MERPKLPKFQKNLQAYNCENYQQMYIALHKHKFDRIMTKLARNRPELYEILPKLVRLPCDKGETPPISKPPEVYEVSRRIKKLSKPRPGLPETSEKKKHHSRGRQQQDQSAGVPPQKLKTKKWVLTLGRQYHVPVKVMGKPGFRYRTMLIPDIRLPLRQYRCSRRTSPRQQLDVPVNHTECDDAAPNADQVKESPEVLDFPKGSNKLNTECDDAAPNADQVKESPEVLDFPKGSNKLNTECDDAAPNADQIKDKGSPEVLDFPKGSNEFNAECDDAAPNADQVKDKGSPEVLDFPKGSNKLKRDALKSSPVKVTPEMDKEFYKALPAYADKQNWPKEGAFGERVLEASRRRLEKRRDALKSSPVKVAPEMDKEFYKTLPAYADMQKWKKEDAFGKSVLEASRRRLEKRREALKSSPVKVTPKMDKEFYKTLPAYADMQKWKKEDAFGKSVLEASRRRLEKRKDGLKPSPVKVTPETDKEFYKTLPAYADMQKWKKEDAFGKSVLEASRRRLEKRRDALKSSPVKVTPEMDKEFYKTFTAYADKQNWPKEGAFGERVLEASRRRLEKRRDALKSSPVKVTPETDKEFYKTLPAYADMQKWKKEDAFGKSVFEASRRRLEKSADMQKWKKEDAFGKSVLEVSRQRLEKRRDALKSSPVKVTPETDKEFYKTLPAYADMQKWKKEDAFGKSVFEASRRRLEKRRDALKSSPVKVTPETDKEFYKTLPAYADMQKWKKEDAFGKSVFEASRRRLEKRRDALKSSPVKVTPEMDKEFYKTLPAYAEMQKWKKEEAFGEAVLEASRRRLEKIADMQKWKKEDAFGKSVLEASRRRLEKRFGDPDSRLPAAREAKESKAECKQLSKYRVPDCCLPAARGTKESKAERKQQSKYRVPDSHLPAACEAKESKAECKEQSKIKTFKLRTPSSLAVIASLRVSLLAQLKGSVQYKTRGDQIIVGGKDHGQPRPKLHR